MAAPAAAASTRSSSLQRLNHVEKKIVQAMDLAAAVMEELASATGPRKDLVASQCHEFMRSIKEIQSLLHEEIRSMCEYRPYENCDYLPRLNSETSLKKLECVLEQVEKLQQTINQCSL